MNTLLSIRTAVIAWVLAASLHWIPIPKYKVYGKTPAEQLALREAMVTDLVDVAFDESERPLTIHSGPEILKRAHTALDLASIASFESGFNERVDNGKIKGPMGEVCILQIMAMKGTPEGWTETDILRNRQRCIRTGLRELHMSYRYCAHLRGFDRYSIFATGRCIENQSHIRRRFERAEKWRSAHPLMLGKGR